MKLESVGILIAMRPFGERDCVAHIFTYDFGLMCGMLRGAATARKNRPLIGQVGNVSWNARLDSQLGAFHWDAEKNLAVPLMMARNKLEFMNAAFELITALLPERERYEKLYLDTVDMLNNLAVAAAPDNVYLQWEINLLRELGYALDLSRCSGCGKNENLEFLSPRTGRAVCCDCAAPYINKLYKLPLDLRTTLRFIESICIQQGADVPMTRRMIARR